MIETRPTERSSRVGRRWLFTVLTTLLLSSLSAYAQIPPSADATGAHDQEARRLFEAGREAYVDEKYQDALNYFQQSHELSQRPQLLFNVGQAADRLGQREQAAEAFRGYLAAVPDAGNRPEVEARIAQLEAAETTPADASVIGIPDLPDGAHQPRDGLYLRGAIGGGGFSDEFSRNLGGIQATASGGTAALELAAGVALKPGLALAAVLAVEWAQADRVTVGGLTVDNASVGVLVAFGGMLDWYLDPAEGWHVQGGIAGSRVTVAGGDGSVADHVAVGGAMLLGGGYEWTVDSGLSIGVLGRITGSRLNGDSTDHNIVAISVLFSATMF